MGYLAGWNMPGYLPETDPVYFEGWEDARKYLSNEVERSIDDGLSELVWANEDEVHALERGLYIKWHWIRVSLTEGKPFAALTSDGDLSFWIIEATPIPEQEVTA